MLFIIIITLLSSMTDAFTNTSYYNIINDFNTCYQVCDTLSQHTNIFNLCMFNCEHVRPSFM